MWLFLYDIFGQRTARQHRMRRQVGGIFFDANLLAGGVAAAPSMFTLANKQSSPPFSPASRASIAGFSLCSSVCVLLLPAITMNYWSSSFTVET